MSYFSLMWNKTPKFCSLPSLCPPRYTKWYLLAHPPQMQPLVIALRHCLCGDVQEVIGGHWVEMQEFLVNWLGALYPSGNKLSHALLANGTVYFFAWCLQSWCGCLRENTSSPRRHACTHAKNCCWADKMCRQAGCLQCICNDISADCIWSTLTVQRPQISCLG